MLEALDTSSATARVAPDLLQALQFCQMATTVRRSAVNREDLKPCWKKKNISLGDQQS